MARTLVLGSSTSIALSEIDSACTGESYEEIELHTIWPNQHKINKPSKKNPSKIALEMALQGRSS